MADGHVPDQLVQDVAVEDLRDEPHALVLAELFAVGGDDAGAFLAAMLQGVEAVVGQLARRSDGRKCRRRRNNVWDSTASDAMNCIIP